MSNFTNPIPCDHINTIMNSKKLFGYAKLPNFLYFDIQKYYPNVDHENLKKILLQKYLTIRGVKTLDNNIENLLKNSKITRYFKKFMKFVDKYLSYSNFD